MPASSTPLIHPAIRELLRAQGRAKFRRLHRAFASPRRLTLTILAIVLACVWLGNVVLSIMFREPASAERFAELVPLGLLVYAAWHAIKNTLSRPEQGIDWTPSEQAWVVAGPFSRRDLLTYRFTGIVTATIVKAACFTVLMLPDLAQPLAGFAGMLLALIFLDLWRSVIERTMHGVSRNTFRRFRWALIAVLATAAFSTIVIAFSSPRQWQSDSTLLSFSLIMHVMHSAEQVLRSLPGRVAMAPFQWFGQVIVTRQLDASAIPPLLGCVTLVLAAIRLVWRVDGYFDQVIPQRERAVYSPHAIAKAQEQLTEQASTPWRRIAWLAGMGPIAWRQWIGARKYHGSLAVAMALPGALALLPLAVCRDGKQALIQVAATLTFYSFLLLPTALKFDFRRDILRMVALKSLPIRPVAIVLGQILTPTLLAFAFQTVVLLLTMCIKPYPAWMLLATLALLLPLDLLIFAIDNMVYLLYPYRLNQEGIEIFLRTTLTFTAKALIFTAGLVATFFWSFAAHQLARWLPGFLHDPALVFVVGGTMLLSGATVVAVLLLARTYVRFDPSQDTPG